MMIGRHLWSVHMQMRQSGTIRDNIFHPLLTGWFAFGISNPLAPLKLIGVHIGASVEWIFPERLSRFLDM